MKAAWEKEMAELEARLKQIQRDQAPLIKILWEERERRSQNRTTFYPQPEVIDLDALQEQIGAINQQGGGPQIVARIAELRKLLTGEDSYPVGVPKCTYQ